MNRLVGSGISSIRRRRRRRLIHKLLATPILSFQVHNSSKIPPCTAVNSYSFLVSSSFNPATVVNSSKIPPSAAAAAAVNVKDDDAWDDSDDDDSDDNDSDDDGGGDDGDGANWDDEDDDLDPQPGDGGAGGGVVLNDLPWAVRAHSIANEVLTHFGHDDDIKLYSFKATPRGYIYLRLDKLPNPYGCPSSEELESYNLDYKTRIDQAGAAGEIPDDLGIEVSSPGAERLLKVPDDLDRFKELPMSVCYVEDSEEKNGVFMLESVDTQSGHCTLKLADVRENRDIQGKGRPLNRKQKEWRLNLPYAMFKRVTLYLDY